MSVPLKFMAFFAEPAIHYFLNGSHFIILSRYGGKLDWDLLFWLRFQKKWHDAILRQTVSGKERLFFKLVGHAPGIRTAAQGSAQRETELTLGVPQDADKLLAVGWNVGAFFHAADFFSRGRQPFHIINMGAVQGKHKNSG